MTQVAIVHGDPAILLPTLKVQNSVVAPSQVTATDGLHHQVAGNGWVDTVRNGQLSSRTTVPRLSKLSETGRHLVTCAQKG